MLGLIAGLAAAVTSVPAARDLLPAANWWEKITVTIAGDGKPQGCRFESSLGTTTAKDCDVVGAPSATSRGHTVSSHDQYESITFERRFSAGAAPPLDAALQPGDTLLGREVLRLAIDSGGKVNACKLVATSGDLMPDYGCSEASAEHFETSAARSAAAREGFMTILVYGHTEHVA